MRSAEARTGKEVPHLQGNVMLHISCAWGGEDTGVGTRRPPPRWGRLALREPLRITKRIPKRPGEHG